VAGRRRRWRDLLVSEIAKVETVIERAKIENSRTAMTKPISGPDRIRSNRVRPALRAHVTRTVISSAGREFPYGPGVATRRPTPEERLRALHEHLGLGARGAGQASCHGTDNRAMLDAIAWSRKFEPGGAWRGVSNDRGPMSQSRARGAAAGGVRGVRSISCGTWAARRMRRVFERTLAMIEPLAWHVVLHFDAETSRFMQKCSAACACLRDRPHGAHPGERGIEQKPFRTLSI